jgi:hypothetical protein
MQGDKKHKRKKNITDTQSLKKIEKSIKGKKHNRHSWSCPCIDKGPKLI